MYNNPLVSIIIPTYKRPDFLKRAIESALNQTYENIEIIVVDDNNPNTEGRERTEKIMSVYSLNPKIKYVKHEKNKNGSAARNTGFKNSGGQYIALLDDDDEFFPKKIESQVACLESKSNDYGACYSNYIRVNADGSLFDKSKENKEGNLYKEVLARNLFSQGGSNLLIRREAYEQINGFDESFDRNQDIEFMARLFRQYKLAYCDEMGLRIYLGNSSSKTDFIEITEKYRNNFDSFIRELSKKDQKEINMCLDVQVLRYLFTSKQVKEAFFVLKERRIPIVFTFRYFLYLVKRRLTKTIYGFNC